ncbi:nuclear transport factor 2 family protein [Camelimonas abortus]|uniref:Nuclear transport factor 2 family protein n=1 Tax=Camelimonas abortus TaxID=1017184 RepID=A0ABV7LBA1_9HYPH
MSNVTGADASGDVAAEAAESAVRAVIQQYFDALYHGDVAAFREVFHPSCRLFTVVDGEAQTFDYEPYMARVAGRPSSASRGDARADAIISVRVSSPTTASATVRDCYLPRHFINELGFVFTGGRWRIASKIWHAFDPA